MRAVWLSLAAIHVWPLLIVAQQCVRELSPENLASLAALVLVLGLFSLKGLDVAALRTDRPKLEFMVWVISAALVHQGPGPDVSIADVSPTVSVGLLVGGAAVSGRVRRRLARAWTLILDRLRGRRPNGANTPFACFAHVVSPGVLRPRLIVASCGARSPPLRA